MTLIDRLTLTVLVPYLLGLFIGWYWFTPHSCDTDAQCAATPPCVLTPGCDGGPEPGHQPWPWLP